MSEFSYLEKQETTSGGSFQCKDRVQGNGIEDMWTTLVENNTLRFASE